MKVFLSHTHKDKPVVEPIAAALSSFVGQDNVFYDSWSIQPGDGIIDKMDEGLAECDFFFFFVSSNSLTSEMVKMEWQNALMIDAKKETKFIPVRLDDCMMPAILRQKLYIDAYKDGLEASIRQMIDVISGGNTYRAAETIFSNLRAYATMPGEEYCVEVEIRAEHFMEPISRYAVITQNKDARVTCLSDNSFSYAKADPLIGGDGEERFPHIVQVARATTPGFPFRFRLSDDQPLAIDGVMHAVAENQFEHVPVTFIMNEGVEIELDKVFGLSTQEQEEYLQRQIQKAGSKLEVGHGSAAVKAQYVSKSREMRTIPYPFGNS